jgi:aspartate/methionine/tyrosine aminotransferase
MRRARRLEHVEMSLLRRVVSQAPPDAVDLGLGEPGIPPPSSVAATITSFGSGEFGYSPNAGFRVLREAVARYLSSRAGPDSICVTNGSQEALLATFLAFLDPGDEVLIPDPGYPGYPPVVRIAGGVPVAYRLPEARSFAFSPEEVERRLTPRTRAILVNTPANPTGTVLSHRDFEELTALARTRDLLVVSDEVYREIYFGPRPASLLDAAEEGIVVGGLSKCAGLTGWRLGWAAGSPDRIAAITVVHQYAATCAPSPSQRLALELLDDSAAEEFASRREVYRARRDLMRELLSDDFPCHSPEGSYYLLLKAALDGDSVSLALDLLKRARVVTIPGAAFGDEASRYLRLSFSAREDVIREGISRLRAALSRGG